MKYVFAFDQQINRSSDSLYGIQSLIHTHISINPQVHTTTFLTELERASKTYGASEYLQLKIDDQETYPNMQEDWHMKMSAICYLVAVHLMSDEGDVCHIRGQDFALMLQDELAYKSSLGHK